MLSVITQYLAQTQCSLIGSMTCPRSPSELEEQRQAPFRKPGPAHVPPKADMDAVDFPVMVQMEDRPQAGHLWGLPAGAWLSASCLQVCCRSAEEGGQSPLCLGIMPSAAREPESHMIALTITREKVQVALSFHCPAHTPHPSLPPTAPSSPTPAHLQEHSLAIGAASGG